MIFPCVLRKLTRERVAETLDFYGIGGMSADESGNVLDKDRYALADIAAGVLNVMCESKREFALVLGEVLHVIW